MRISVWQRLAIGPLRHPSIMPLDEGSALVPRTLAFTSLSQGVLRVGQRFSSTHRPLQVCCLADDGDGGPPRYMPKVSDNDPIVAAAQALSSGSCGNVTHMELLDSRWNGNEAFRIDRQDMPPLFAKINRVEDPTVFMSEALGLTAMLNSCKSVRAPRPLHVGRLPKVGDFGPGAFMLLQWFDLVPFGASRTGVQKELATMLADMHLSTEATAHVHEGRFGFPANNFLALTPMDNRWMTSWPKFFAKRLVAQVRAAYRDKPYGRAPLSQSESDIKILAQKVVNHIEVFFDCGEIVPSLLHGDLWIGNVSATKNDEPVIYDPACFFGHHEFDLAIMRMYGGYTDEFWVPYFERIPKQRGFDDRAKLYELYQYFNQLNLFGDPNVKSKVETLVEDLANATSKSALS